MKPIVYILFFTAVLLSGACSKKVLISSGKDYWNEFHAGDTTTLHTEYESFQKETDTIIHFTNFYQNGVLKSKVIMKNEFLLKIELVKDTLGEKIDFGHLRNGYVIQFRNDGLGREKEGLYVDGNREGWWKTYHYTGTIIDSTLY